MYEGKLVRLREYRKEDIEKAKEFLNDFEVRKNLQPTLRKKTIRKCRTDIKKRN